MKNKLTISITILFMATLFSVNALHGELLRRNIDIQNVGLRKAGSMLKSNYSANICTEEVRFFTVEKDKRIAERKGGISIKLENATLIEALDALVKAEPSYTWQYDEETNHYNIFPIKDAPLGWKIEETDFKDQSLKKALFDDDLLGLRKYNISYLPPFSSNGYDKLKFSFKAKDVTARKALNKICFEYAKSLRQDLSWTSYAVGEGAIFKNRFVDISPVPLKYVPKKIEKEKIIADFEVENKRIDDIINSISETYQVCIGSEMSPLNVNNNIPPEKVQQWIELRGKRFTFKMENADVKQVLDKLIEIAPEYTSKIDEKTRIINIYPKENAPLGWFISQIDLKDKTLQQILVDEDLLGFKKHNINCPVLVYHARSWSLKPISLQAENITAREAFNIICTLHYDDSPSGYGVLRLYWQLKPGNIHRDTWTGSLDLYHRYFPKLNEIQ
jgi:hypothetical protein